MSQNFDPFVAEWVAVSSAAKYNLVEKCLKLAQILEYPDLEIQSYIEKINEISKSLEVLLSDVKNPTYLISMLNEHLFSRLGFSGDTNDYYDPKNKGPHPVDTYIWRYRQLTSAPPRIAGEGILFIDNLRAVGNRRAWQYIPGQRRVKLAPDIGFDTPLSQGGSAATFDDVQTFFGSPERYNWKLIGKTEKFIMYNNYKLTDDKVCPPEVAFKTKNFMNPDCTRWELHRVWNIEATLKPNFRHIYPRRLMYFDEDNMIYGGTSVNYDASGKVYRISHGVAWTFYEDPVGTLDANGFVVYDLTNGSYVYAGYPGLPGNDTGWGPGYGPEGKISDFYFSPEAMAGEGLR